MQAGSTSLLTCMLVGMVQVVGISKLKTKYEAHESKRRLCSEYDLFCADERVLPQLPKLLGASTTQCLDWHFMRRG